MKIYLGLNCNINKIMHDISNKSVKDLKQYCRDNNITGFSNKKKKDLIDLINKNLKVDNNINPEIQKKITINNDYETIKKYYDDILNKDKDLVVTSNDEPTPMDCVEEMINKIPEEFWKRKNIKILDPCCGSGNFPIYIYFKLLKYHNKDDILNDMLYFNDINIDRLDVLQNIFDHTINVYSNDFLTFNNNIKFDLIVANPPYAKFLPNGKRASKNHNLIGLFIQKSFELLNDNGFILYITPDNWMSLSDRNTLIKYLTEMQIIYINIHIAKKYFKKIGSSFVWYLIEKKPYYKDIEIEGIWKKNLYSDFVKSEVRNYIPLYYNKIIQSILHKTLDDPKLKKFDIKTSSDLHKYTQRNIISNDKDDKFKYKLIHTPTQTVWSTRPHKFQDSYKVFISTTSYYSAFVDNCGMTQSIAFLICKDLIEAENMKNILMHDLYKFLNNICRYGNFNNIRILQKFPYCNDYNKIYDDFNITQDEIEFINNNI